MSHPVCTFTRKGYGRIYVDQAENVERVREIIRELDEFEFTYLPSALVAPFSEYPKITYTHKFDGLCLHRLTAVCWKRGIFIWACDNQHNEFLEDVLPLPAPPVTNDSPAPNDRITVREKLEQEIA